MPNTYDASTYCDDGNTADGDGCSSTCAVESKWVCSGGNRTNAATCIDKCGDGFVTTPTSGYCDDGNNVDGDGCSATCGVEAGWQCTPGSMTGQSVCTDICGDGKIMPSNPATTYCDDGNVLEGDGCSSLCVIEGGYTCSGGTQLTPDV